MPETIGPAIARERLRVRLRELREARGLSPAEVEERLTWPAAAIDEVESGRRVPPPLEVEALLGLYDASGPADESLIYLAGIARSRLWWARRGMTDAYQDFVAYEAEVARIGLYHPLLVPGLLQTRRYALAATATILRLPPDDRDVVARADLRAERRRVVADRVAAGDPVRIVAVVDEIVLRRAVGGAEVQREQLDHLVAQAQLDHVTLVVLPTALGGHAGLGGGFELIEPGDDPEFSVVLIESATGDQIVRMPAAIAYYRQVLAELIAAGLSGDEAIALLRAARDET
jgi:transcriptional regulator with XRE-family HTH domain